MRALELSSAVLMRKGVDDERTTRRTWRGSMARDSDDGQRRELFRGPAAGINYGWRS